MHYDTAKRRAIALVYRDDAGRREYLAVSSSSDSSRMVFPGGHIDPGETPAEAAARETWEESGVVVSIGEHLGCYIHDKADGRRIRTDVFLATPIAIGEAIEDRRVAWMDINEIHDAGDGFRHGARELLTAAHPEAGELLNA